MTYPNNEEVPSRALQLAEPLESDTTQDQAEEVPDEAMRPPRRSERADPNRKSWVYLIRNLLDGLVYVGVTVSPKRWSRHKSMLRAGQHHSPRLQAAWDRDGEANFVYEIIEDGLETAQRRECEQYHMERLQCTDPAHGYNQKKGGDHITDEWRAKRSQNSIAAYERKRASGDLTQLKPHKCTNCEDDIMSIGPRLCDRCYDYQKKHGVPRPKALAERFHRAQQSSSLDSEADAVGEAAVPCWRCKNCGSSDPYKRARGLCAPCYVFQRTKGVPRPRELYSRFKACRGGAQAPPVVR